MKYAAVWCDVAWVAICFCLASVPGLGTFSVLCVGWTAGVFSLLAAHQYRIARWGR